MEMSAWENVFENNGFDYRVEMLEGTLEACLMELKASQEERKPSRRTRAFRNFVRLFERAQKQFDRLPDE